MAVVALTLEINMFVVDFKICIINILFDIDLNRQIFGQIRTKYELFNSIVSICF